MDRKRLRRPVVAVDTETTGLGTAARLLEIAAVKFVGGREVSRFSTLVDPEGPIPAAASRVHGITDKDVRGQPSAASALRRFFAFCRGAQLVAHNAPFDRRVIERELERAGQGQLRKKITDTLGLARERLPHLANHKLGTVARSLGVESEGPAHRALADGLMVGRVFHALLGVFSGERNPRKRR